MYSPQAISDDPSNYIIFSYLGSIPAIYFPVGLDKTCEFATKECLETCPSGLITNPHEERALRYFQEKDAQGIAMRIYHELQSFGDYSNMIYWHAWGDCPSTLVDKELAVMKLLYDMGAIQYGFTRNHELWDKTPCLPRLRIGLSVNSKKDAVRMSDKKLVCFPNFETSQARLFLNGKLRAKCNDIWCILPDGKVWDADCVRCYAKKMCCFHSS